MEKTTNTAYPANIEDLIEEMESGRYSHLQIFMHRNQSSLGFGFGKKFLMVTHNDFGVFQINNVDYSHGSIKMQLTNSFTGETTEKSIDINDEHPEYVFISWNDIKSMIYSEKSLCLGEDILELDGE